MLALYGLPPAADMVGRPLASLLDDEALNGIAGTTVASYDEYRGEFETPTGGVSGELEERLKALGYL